VRQHEFWAKSLRQAILRNGAEAADAVLMQGEAA
jgi:benzoate/toluate 1,2-dioxygenase alpha subunit